MSTSPDSPGNIQTLPGNYPYFYGFILPCIGALGLAGNIASFIVLKRRYMRSSCNVYLLSLSFVDSLVLIALMCLYMPEALLYMQDETKMVSMWMLAAVSK